MKKRETASEFVVIINDAIKIGKIKQVHIADRIGVNRSTMSRIFAGTSGVNKPTARSIVQAINEIVGTPIVDERAALEVAGFDNDKRDRKSGV